MRKVRHPAFRIVDLALGVRNHVAQRCLGVAVLCVLDVAPVVTRIFLRAEEIMGKAIAWAPGLPLRGDGFETKYYMKEID